MLLNVRSESSNGKLRRWLECFNLAADYQRDTCQPDGQCSQRARFRHIARTACASADICCAAGNVKDTDANRRQVKSDGSDADIPGSGQRRHTRGPRGAIAATATIL